MNDPGSNSRLARSLVGIVVAALATALAARLTVPVPGTDVPQSAQTLAVVVAGALLGWRGGIAAMLAYLAAGAVGLPVFADGAAGWSHLTGPTAGYLLGFVVAAGGVGWGVGRTWGRSVTAGSLVMLVGHGVILGLGWVRLAADMGAAGAFAAGVRPFLWGGVVKSVLGAVVVVAWRWVRARRGSHGMVGVVVVGVAAGACAGDGVPASGPTLRDSAGVALVDNPAVGSWGEGGWQVQEALVLRGEDGRPETEFGYVVDVAADGDTLYVLDQYAQEVRVFGPGGGLVRTLGGPGDGPGELSRFASSLLLLGDTVAVVDWGRGRVHRFARDGRFLDDALLPGAGARSWWRVAGDGRVYARSLTRVTRDDGRWGGEDRLMRIGGGMAVADTVFTFRYDETDIGARGALRVPLVVNAPTWEVLPDGRLVWTTLDDAQLRIHGPDGRLTRLVRSERWIPSAPGPSDTDGLLARMREKMVMLGGSADAVDHLPVDLPERLPALTSVRAGPDATIWVQRGAGVADVHPMALNTPDPPTGWGGAAWDVLDADGRLLGTVTLDPGARVARILDDRVVGVRRDALDRDEVVVWRLLR
ncbi:MAG: biotin transporter BioY [Longimicrobiales bacterium]